MTEPIEFRDKELKCIECGKTFIFEVGEQQFFADKGFTNDPRRCKPCRELKKKRVEGALNSHK